jgi:hypothetical protein
MALGWDTLVVTNFVLSQILLCATLGRKSVSGLFFLALILAERS